MEEQEVKKSFIENHPRIVFWFRLVSWALFAGVLPFLFIALRFNIFRKVSALSLSGWGVIAVILLVCFSVYLIKMLRKGFSFKNVFAKQCCDGICHIIIPLVAFLVLVRMGIKNLELLSQALGCAILCELIAIPLNPLPAWVDKCRKERGEDENKDAVDYFFERFKRAKKEENKDGR